MVKTQYKTKVESMMSDEGGEYKSEAFKTLLKEKGIKILRSSPYTPQENGRAERFMRTMMDKAEAMRIFACIPDSWWEFAIEQAVHIYNRTPLSRLKWLTPHEQLKGEVPSIEHLQVFGCGAYVHIPANIRKNKLAPKSELMTYIGVAPDGHGNRFMRSPNNVVFTSSHAIFEETLFPKCTHEKCGSRRLPILPPTDTSNNEDDIPPMMLDDDEDDNIPPTRHRENPPERRSESPHDDAGDKDPLRTPPGTSLPQDYEAEFMRYCLLSHDLACGSAQSSPNVHMFVAEVRCTIN
jgi:hypothetical protein